MYNGNTEGAFYLSPYESSAKYLKKCPILFFRRKQVFAATGMVLCFFCWVQ
jgi:hypothetical protein